MLSCFVYQIKCAKKTGRCLKKNLPAFNTKSAITAQQLIFDSYFIWVAGS
jgi:hypothetical protein